MCRAISEITREIHQLKRNTVIPETVLSKLPKLVSSVRESVINMIDSMPFYNKYAVSYLEIEADYEDESSSRIHFIRVRLKDFNNHELQYRKFIIEDVDVWGLIYNAPTLLDCFKGGNWNPRTHTTSFEVKNEVISTEGYE